MCLKDFRKVLRKRGLNLTEAQIRWALTSGKIARPPLDGSLRFQFTTEHVQRLIELFETAPASHAG